VGDVASQEGQNTREAEVNWAYEGNDPSIVLFTTAVQRFGLTLPADAHVAELGCAETDWIERMRGHNPQMTITGVEPNPDSLRGRHGCNVGSAMDPQLFAEGSLDAVVMLGALEHFGLGFYGDPLDEDGDIRTMQNVARWLKPRGWVYADVPCNFTYSVTENRHFRIYSRAEFYTRLNWGHMLGWFCTTHEPQIGQGFDGWPIGDVVPYHYVAFWARKHG
jgi:hypothetical protein